MELLAALPAIVGLVGKGRELRNVTEGGDWIDFLLECLSNTSEDLKGRTTSVGDFLRLYVSLNAYVSNQALVTLFSKILTSVHIQYIYIYIYIVYATYITNKFIHLSTI